MKKVAIVAALPGELKPLTRGWRRTRREEVGAILWEGRVGQTACIAVCAGMGAGAAARAYGIAAEGGELQGLISLGWAGALSCGMHPGKAYSIAQVVDALTGERFDCTASAADGAPLTLATLDHMAQPQEKRGMAETYRAVLVDMESATIARLASARQIPFYCFKSVSDGPQEKLPDFSRYTDPRGRLRTAALLAHLILRPGYWPALLRLRKNAKIGAEAMAAALRQFLGAEQTAE